jgi:hypothetical protein
MTSRRQYLGKSSVDKKKGLRSLLDNDALLENARKIVFIDPRGKVIGAATPQHTFHAARHCTRKHCAAPAAEFCAAVHHGAALPALHTAAPQSFSAHPAEVVSFNILMPL